MSSNNGRDLFYRIDKRDRRDLLNEIGGLADSYAPEWVFDEKNPDIGSVLALIFANQMTTNIDRLNLAIHKYRTELVNMMNLNLKPAIPARGFVTMSLVQDTIDGVAVPKRTQLLADGGGESMLVYETSSDVFITNSAITDVISVSRTFGKVTPVYGGPAQPELVDSDWVNAAGEGEGAEEPTEAVGNEEELAAGIPPFKMFDYSDDGIAQNGILFLHEHIFNIPDGARLQVKLAGPELQGDLAALLSEPGKYNWSFLANGAETPFSTIKQIGPGLLELTKSGEPDKLRRNGREYYTLMLRANGVVKNRVSADTFEFSSESEGVRAEYLAHAEEQLETGPEKDGAFMPFGETAAMYDEFYIGQDQIFAQKGAVITVDFDLELSDRTVAPTPEEQQEELKVIKRKPKRVAFEVAKTSVQRVIYEYFNGTGWAKLPLDEDYSAVFAGGTKGHVTMRFRCPSDMENVVSGSFEGLALRVRITQADNCYMVPCVHTMPVIKNLKFAHRYGERERWHVPEYARRISGVEYADLTEALGAKRGCELFEPVSIATNCVMLGFNRPFLGTPISIYFEIEDHIPFDLPPLRFMYSTGAGEGFRRLKVLDRTENFKHSGTVVFVPPQDMRKNRQFGLDRWWLRIDDETGKYDNQSLYKINVHSVLPNTVEVRNVETLPMEYFYIDSSRPNMTFQLAARNILTAEVFVNEFPRLTPETIQRMLDEDAGRGDVRAEYDYTGEITDFYVRWTEVDSFDSSQPGDRHYIINRTDNTINFGDGVNVAIPPSGREAAFTVRVTSCDGSEGNLPADTITIPRSNLNFIGAVTNTSPTFAGSDMEDIDGALARGANMLNGGGRLVTSDDFERETLAFSSAIDKVRCVCGRDAGGKKNSRAVTMVVLVKEYMKNAGVFNSMRDEIKSLLLSRSEMTVSSEELQVIEPVYIVTDVTVWVTPETLARTLEIQTSLIERITGFLDPVTGGYDGNGWSIGTLPAEPQLYMVLKTMQTGFTIDKITMTGRYRDFYGEYETEISKIRDYPFAVAVNGRHTVIING